MSVSVNRARIGAAIDRVDVSAFRIPTERPEADGTLEWSSRILIVVDVEAGGVRGMRHGYADTAIIVAVAAGATAAALRRPRGDREQRVEV